MKKNFTNLGIVIVAVIFVAALTGTAIFANDNGQVQKILAFLPLSSDPVKTSEFHIEEKESYEIEGVITGLTDDSISIDGNMFRLDESSDMDADLAVGSLVEITFVQLPDGSFLVVDVDNENSSMDTDEMDDDDVDDLDDVDDVDDIDDVDDVDDVDDDVDDVDDDEDDDVDDNDDDDEVDDVDDNEDDDVDEDDD